MTIDPSIYLAAIPAVLLVGLTKGGMGEALALMGVPILAMSVPPVQAAAILLPILVVMDGVSLWIWRHHNSRPLLTILLPGAIVGVAVGWATSAYVPRDALRLIIEPRIPHPAAAYEMDLCYVLRMMSLLLGRPGQDMGLSLGLGHAQPAGTTLDDYRSRLGCEVVFDEPCYWLELPAALPRQELPGSHPLLVQTLATQADLQLKLLDREPAVTARVSHLIALGANEVEAVAAKLGLSSRSLQRRLKEEGTNFGVLRDSAQRRRAEQLLSEPRVALKEVAFFLGYEERGLAVACQRWFGASPGALRARLIAG